MSASTEADRAPAGRGRPDHVGLALLLVTCYVGIGLPIGALGVAWPQMRATFDQPLAALGVLLLTFTVGNLITSVVHGRVAHRVGTGRLVVAGEGVGAFGMTLVALSPVWAGVLAGMAVLGISVALLDAELNSYVAVHHGPRMLHVMHGGFGIGATLGPLAVSLLLDTDLSWRVVFGAMAVLWFTVTVAFVARRRRWNEPVVLLDDEGRPTSGDPPRSPRLVAVLVLGLAFFFVLAGVELGAGSWGFTFLTADGHSESAAGLTITLYWGAFTIGRLVLGSVGHRVSPARVIHAATAGVVVGALLLLLGGAAAVVGFVVIGASQCGVFASMVSLTPGRLGPTRAHRVMGLQFASANLGGSLLPALIGVVAQRRGETSIAACLVVLAVAMAATNMVLTRVSNRASLVTTATPS